MILQQLDNPKVAPLLLPIVEYCCRDKLNILLNENDARLHPKKKNLSRKEIFASLGDIDLWICNKYSRDNLSIGYKSSSLHLTREMDERNFSGKDMRREAGFGSLIDRLRKISGHIQVNPNDININEPFEYLNDEIVISHYNDDFTMQKSYIFGTTDDNTAIDLDDYFSKDKFDYVMDEPTEEEYRDSGFNNHRPREKNFFQVFPKKDPETRVNNKMELDPE
jgi:hypothetical protein